MSARWVVVKAIYLWNCLLHKVTQRGMLLHYFYCYLWALKVELVGNRFSEKSKKNERFRMENLFSTFETIHEFMFRKTAIKWAENSSRLMLIRHNLRRLIGDDSVTESFPNYRRSELNGDEVVFNASLS